MKYDRCEYCGGTVREEHVTVDLRTKDRLHIFDNVPVGVCRRCGERYYRGPVLERLSEMASQPATFTRTIRVPRCDFAEAEGS